MNEENIIAETTQKETICKGCSGKLLFAPGTNHLKCPACGTENEIEISTQVFEELVKRNLQHRKLQLLSAVVVAHRQHLMQMWFPTLVHAVVRPWL